ncbi:MAG: HD domain-containing protein [Planctomycetes bacterium]|nr:HD domain-containing protein [Planctomycetota bacterium]
MATSIGHKFVKDLAAYEPIDQVFQLVTKQQRKTKTGSIYFRLELRDKTGKVATNIWDNIAQLDSISEYSFVRIKGQVDLYQGELQLKTSSIAPASDKDINPDFFAVHTALDIEALYNRLTNVLARVKDPHLVKLLEAFVKDEDFIERFKKSPAAVEKHQPYTGGLMEHTLNMANLALSVGQQYQTLNLDLLLVGIFLHDIGKIREYETKVTPQITDEGRLVGHTVFGILMLNEKVNKIKGFPTEYTTLLEHLIASHHGEREYGAPVLPMTQEAIVLHYLDNLDARLGEYQLLIQNAPKNSNWTEWSKGLERKFFIPH